jgi:hypothetical protein
MWTCLALDMPSNNQQFVPLRNITHGVPRGATKVHFTAQCVLVHFGDHSNPAIEKDLRHELQPWNLASVGMGNVLDKTKQEQVIALGRLGWSLRRIEQATGVRRETAGGYLRSAGVALGAPDGWGRKPPKPATLVATGSSDSKPAIEVTTGSGGPKPNENSKPANEVTTGFSPPATAQEADRKHRQVSVKRIARRPCGNYRGAATRWASGRIW